MMGIPCRRTGGERSLTISSSRVDPIHQREKRTDTERQQRLHLRIALRGKSSKGKGRHWCWSLQQAVSPQVMLDIDPVEGCLPCTGGNHQYPLPVQNYAALHSHTCSISILYVNFTTMTAYARKTYITVTILIQSVTVNMSIV